MIQKFKAIRNRVNDAMLSALVSAETRRSVTLGAVGAGILSTGSAHAASTGVSAGTIFQNLSRQAQSAANLVVNGSFIAGILLAGNGIWEMKKAGDAEDRGNASHKSGGIKIVCGGALAAVAPVTGIGIGTIFNGTAGTSPQLSQVSGFQTN